MRIITRKELPLVLAAIVFAVIMGGLHILLHGISRDFGAGLALGLVLGIFIAGLAIGWKRGELD